MKKIVRVFAISLIMTILIVKISYAATITSQQLNKSIEKLLLNDIKVERDSSLESITMQSQNATIEGNKIKIIEKETKKELIIFYTIKDNVCKFQSNIQLGINADSTKDEVVESLSLVLFQAACYDVCYLAVADALGVDLSLAYTYYAQNYNNESIDVQNKVFSIKTNLPQNGSKVTSLDVSTMELQIDFSEMQGLDLKDINQSDTYTVTVMAEENINPPTGTGQEGLGGQEGQGTQNGQENGGQQQTPTPENDNGKEQNPSVKPSVTDKENTANGEIPKAGLNQILGLIMIGIIFIAILAYRKNKEYKDILK